VKEKTHFLTRSYNKHLISNLFLVTLKIDLSTRCRSLDQITGFSEIQRKYFVEKQVFSAEFYYPEGVKHRELFVPLPSKDCVENVFDCTGQWLFEYICFIFLLIKIIKLSATEAASHQVERRFI
jgi:hypothetical protein